MALHQFVCGLAVAIVLTTKGSHASSVCGTGGSPGNWPWQASITQDGGYICGGTLINDQWVLTAASYIGTWGSYSSLVVYLGSTLSHTYYDSNMSRTVVDKQCYTTYDIYYLSFGICLLKLSAPVTFTSNVQPVCLAERGSTFYSGVRTWVAGWGSTFNGDFAQYSYYDLNSSVVGVNECSCRAYNSLPNNTVCAENEYNTNLRSVGLPLMVQTDSVWVQAGVLSVGCWGYGPCLFLDVSKYEDWIANAIGSNATTSFVKFTSSGVDSDVIFNCTTDQIDLFASGSEKVHFSQPLSLCGLTMLLYVMR